ncbi:MAG TPA: VOC family protein [Chitinophagaceae bacterium]
MNAAIPAAAILKFCTTQMRQKLNLITLGVDNFEKSLEFYEKGLGWKKSDKSMDGLALFPLGGITLALYPRQELSDDTTLRYQPTEFSGLTISYNARSEKEVDEVLKQVEKLGAIIIKPAQKVFWGGYSGYFKDLDGYLFEVAFNPFWELDENDNLKL